MKTMAQFVRMGMVIVFAAGFFAVFAEGAVAASCFFNPNNIQADKDNVVTYAWVNLEEDGIQSGFRIDCDAGTAVLPDNEFTSDTSGTKSINIPEGSLTDGKYNCKIEQQADAVLQCTMALTVSSGSSKTCTYNGKSGTCIASSQTCSGESGPDASKCEAAREKCCVSSSSSTCNASYCKAQCASTDDTSQGAACNGFCNDKDPGTPKYCPPKSSGGGGGSGTTSPVNITLVNPLKYNTVQQVLMALLYALQGVIVVLSLVFIVIGAVLYITSAGNQARVTSAKTAITAALIGLAIGILAPTFLKEVATVLGWNATAPLPDEVTQVKGVADILLSVLNFLLGIVGILAIIFLVVGAIMFLGATGDMNRIGVAKKIIQYALLGIVVALASLVIVRQLAEFFAPATT